jgi:hypothetical protein
MIIMKNFSFARILVSLSMIGLIISPSLARAAGSFSITPAKVEISIDPGQTEERTIVVANRLGRSATFEISVQDVAPSGDEKNPINLLGKNRGPYSLRNYVHPSIDTITLGQGEVGRVPVKISIPADAPPSGLYGAVTLSAYAATNTEVNARVISGLGALFFVRINGPVKELGKLQSFRLSPGRLIIGDRNLSFEIVYNNAGNIYLNPYGVIGVKKWGRGQAEELKVSPWFVLPSSSRLREIAYRPELEPGLYRADLFQNRGYNDVIDTESFWFLKLDWGLAIALGSALFLLGLSLWRLVRNIFLS